MPYTLILHIQNEQPVVGESDEIPAAVDKLVILKNPRRLDGKDLTYLSENVTTVIWPVERLNFIEVQSGEQEDKIIGFVRE
jgi:hypothetical protein